MTGSLEGRIALVTGSAHNLGRSIAAHLGHEGALVLAHARTDEEASEAAAAVRRAGGEAIPVSFDLADGHAVDEGLARLDGQGLTPDALVLNAAHLGVDDRPPHEQPIEFFDAVLAVNVSAAYRCIVRTAQRLIAIDRPGAIVAISSLAGERAIHFRPAYNVSKAALDGMVRSLAIDFASYGIRINAIAPGYVWSDRWPALQDSEVRERRSTIPSGAETGQDEIARLAAFLLSDAAPTLTGERIVIDGGLAAQQLPRRLSGQHQRKEV